MREGYGEAIRYMILTITRVRFSANIARVDAITTVRPPLEQCVAPRLSQVKGHTYAFTHEHTRSLIQYN